MHPEWRCLVRTWADAWIGWSVKKNHGRQRCGGLVRGSFVIRRLVVRKHVCCACTCVRTGGVGCRWTKLIIGDGTAVLGQRYRFLMQPRAPQSCLVPRSERVSGVLQCGVHMCLFRNRTRKTWLLTSVLTCNCCACTCFVFSCEKLRLVFLSCV